MVVRGNKVLKITIVLFMQRWYNDNIKKYIYKNYMNSVKIILF